ncbi:integrase [Herbaspirillum sp. BH-1]|uniref:DNA-binding protein n=1 Tax=Herbaspirillum sp. (strain BH-1) TaxID=2058884 RepID=UPI000C8866AA|nr:DNA-binding protein [Herbaspirillum sp. BH-1]PLY59916.1 integrase [Herbaspirillum sp. BH-1]
MARTGLYKSEVKKARDSLLALGRHPSVDAVRVELGNTGSKTTIHKYLKELEEEEGIGQQPRSISAALQEMVERLASQLQAEADERVSAAREEVRAVTARMEQALAEANAANAELSTRLDLAGKALIAARAAHESSREECQQQAVALRALEVRTTALQERLEENEQHRLSLEDKHQHARAALDHYRSAAKEQREQDQRQHEQQLQTVQAELRQLRQELIVKQTEITRVNQEGVRLVADLSPARQALVEQQALADRREQQLESLQQVAAGKLVLEAQLADRNAALASLQASRAQTEEALAGARKQLQETEIELAAARARLETHEALTLAWRQQRNHEGEGDQQAPSSGPEDACLNR